MPNKRQRNKEARHALKKHKCSGSHDQLHLLDLPNELLLEIFCLSTNAALAETCKYMCALLCASPSSKSCDASPPFWLQQRFIVKLNPYFPFALEKALRRRFCSAATIKHCHRWMADSQWQELTIPLRLIIPPIDLRSLCLHTELFLRGVRIRPSSMNKALVIWAGHAGPTNEGAFWPQFQHCQLERDVLFAAFKAAARKHHFGQLQSFSFLAQHFGFPDNLGQELMAWAVKRKDMATVTALQQHGIIPDVQTLNKLLL